MALDALKINSLLVYGVDGLSSGMYKHIDFANIAKGYYIPSDIPLPLFHWANFVDYKADSFNRIIYEAPEEVQTQSGRVKKIRMIKYANQNLYDFLLLDSQNNAVGGAVNCYLPESTYLDITNRPLAPPLPTAPIWFTMVAGTNGNNDWVTGWGMAYIIHPAQKALHHEYDPYTYQCTLNNVGALDDFLAANIRHVYDSEGAAPTGEPDGGGGMYSRADFEIPVPPLPSVSICDTGMTSLFHVTTAEMQALGQYLWSSAFFDNILKNFTSPLENIISLGCVPFIAFTETPEDIVIGNLNSNLQAGKLSTSYYELDCGTIDIPEYYKTFADYYATIDLYLPYIGKVSIPVDDVMAGSINVIYHVDVFSGACVAFIRCYTGRSWHVLQSHQGNVLTSFPISGANYTGVYSGLLRSASQFAVGNVMGGVESGLNTKPTYSRSGSIGSTAGLMGIQYPYLIFNTPQYIVAETFREMKGHTSNLTVTIGDETGFLSASVTNDDLIDFDCTVEELQMIADKLSEGIRLGGF